ncbi:unnamed protein product [Brachionus calyciflorus]|uniref:Reverse transcriptase domain-containing protein n=1 Tax=Brachionus calyciflorus TaxID=104777 RepID=A0A814JCF0_9BILA|nr:unnamed protein product [Brachionus calyciflorus]
MLKAGIISPGKTGTWASPAFLLKQKSGYRFIVDYRKVNSITKPFFHPLPRVDDILDKLSKGKFFSHFFSRKGYFQISVLDNSKHKTGFTVPFGIYEFNRVPYGLTNAPAFFSAIMQSILGGLEFVQVYIDDIIIFSENESEHLEHIQIVLDKLTANNFLKNADKCVWMQKSIKILGHIIDETGIRMDPEKIAVIKNMKTPKTVWHK